MPNIAYNLKSFSKKYNKQNSKLKLNICRNKQEENLGFAFNSDIQFSTMKVCVIKWKGKLSKHINAF